MDNVYEIIEEYDETWEIETSGGFTQTVSDSLREDGFSEAAIDELVRKNGVEILGQCPNPKSPTNIIKTGIIIGKVQSGKTSNFIMLSALAFDNDYDIVIILAGTKDDLVVQNHSRIQKSFGSSVKILSVKKDKQIINSKDIERIIKNGDKLVITSIKLPLRLRQLSEAFNTEFLKGRSMLIIDDEADQASLNNKVKQGDETATYKSIIDLKSRFTNGALIEVTATPYANMLIQSIDQLSPDFGALVYPGKEYCGFEQFHTNAAPYMIRNIPDAAELFDQNLGAPESLIEALKSFFVLAAIGNVKFGKTKKWSMLVHPSRLKDKHGILGEQVSQLLVSWQQKCDMLKKGSADYSLNDFLKEFEESYDDIVEETPRLKSEHCISNFDNIKDSLIRGILSSKVHLINSANAEPNEKIFDNNIFIGGDKTGRGITFKNLIVSYLPRRAKGKQQADTVEQRARWFGYKMKYIDLCRVYLTKEVARDFMKIAEFEEDLWETVQTATNFDIPFKDIERLFILSDDNIIPTRSSAAEVSRQYFGEWTRQNYVNWDIHLAKENIEIVEEIKSMGNNEDYLPKYSGERKIIRNVKFADIANNFLSKITFPVHSKLGMGIISKLIIAFNKKGLDPICDIVFVNPNGKTKPRLREIDSTDCEINQLFQGHSPQNKFAKILYPGDSDLFDSQNRQNMQLQIHYIAPKDDESMVEPVFALHLPIDLRRSIGQLVGRK
jgi:hypothetical protein